MQGVTFDFHHTLAVSPRQFELEIRLLPAAVLRRIGIVDEPVLHLATEEYRKLRARVTASGNEVDACTAVVRIAAMLRIDVDRQTVSATVDELMRETYDDFSAVPGAVDTVRYVHALGIPIGVISSAVHHAYVEWSLARLGIEHCVHTVTTSASSGFYKSVAGIFLRACSDLDIVPHLSLHVGDSRRWDVAGAQRANLRTAWLQTDRHESVPAGARLAEPDFTLTSLAGAGPRIVDWLSEIRDAHRD